MSLEHGDAAYCIVHCFSCLLTIPIGQEPIRAKLRWQASNCSAVRMEVGRHCQRVRNIPRSSSILWCSGMFVYRQISFWMINYCFVHTRYRHRMNTLSRVNSLGGNDISRSVTFFIRGLEHLISLPTWWTAATLPESGTVFIELNRNKRS